MKDLKTGNARIFGKALQSALGPAFLARKSPFTSKENRPIVEGETAPATVPEVVTPTFESPYEMEINGNNNRFPTSHDVISNNQSVYIHSSDLHFLGEDDHLATFPETCMEDSVMAYTPTSYYQCLQIGLFPEDLTPNFENSHNEYSHQNEFCFSSPLFDETSTNDLHSWLEIKNLEIEIKEAQRMDTNNENELWLKKNRLMALQQLQTGSHSHYFSNTGLSSYSTNSSGGSTPDVQYNCLYNRFCPISLQSSPTGSLSSLNSLEDATNSNWKSEIQMPERPIVLQKEQFKSELIKEGTCLKNGKSSTKNSKMPSQVNSVFQVDEKKELQLNPEKDSQPKKVCSEILVSESGSGNCCWSPKPGNKNENNVAILPSYDATSLIALKSTAGFFDSHCHIDFMFDYQNFRGTYADFMAQHKGTYPESYQGCIAVFCKPFTFAKRFMWQKILEQDKVWGAFGVHPKSAKFYDDRIERALENALSHPKVKALGEIGLDYSIGDESTKLLQHYVFKRQLEIAQRRNLRLVIHCRDADDDTIKIMREVLPKDKIFHLHCFTGSWKNAQKWIKEFPNVFIGITNLVTFPSAHATHEVAREISLDRLLLETDAPYFVPRVMAKSTKHSHPGMAIHVAAQIAAIKGIAVNTVLQWTSANTRIVYDIS